MSSYPYSRSIWQETVDVLEIQLEPWTRTAPDGSRFIDPESCPGPLAKKYGELIAVGLEYGWLTSENA